MDTAHFRLWLRAGIAYLAYATLAFYEFIVSGGDRVAGNFGDNRFCIYMLEHWYRTFGGHDVWSAPRFYAPAGNVLGYSETLFLNAFPYSLFRLAGLDLYLSYQWSLILYSLIGYIGVLVLLRRYLRLGEFWAISGAVLFTFSNINHLWILSAQTYSVMLLPTLLLLLLASVDLAKQGRRRAAVPMISFGALLGLLFFSAYYIAWFFVLYALIACLTFVSTQHSPLSNWRLSSWRTGGLFAVGAISFVIALVPFFLTYGPLIVAGRTRPFSAVLADALPIQEVINVGAGNIFWGQQFEMARKATFTYGVPPLLLIAFAVLTMFVASRLYWMPDRGDYRARVQLVCGIAGLVGILLLTKHNEVTMWFFVWLAVPGGKAIRVLPRFMIVLNLFIVLVTIFGLQQLWGMARTATLPGSRSRALYGSLFAGFVFLLLVEQLNTAQVHDISRKSEMARLDRIGPNPVGCRTAFLVEDEATTLNPIGLQIDMMLVAQKHDLATVNGYSGFEPVGWNLHIPKGPDYLRRVEKWLDSHGLVEGACAADISHGVWKRAYYADSVPVGLNANQVFYLPRQLMKIEPQMPRAFDSLTAPELFYTVAGVKSGTIISSTGKPGYLQYGPYLPAVRGSYLVQWFGTIHDCQDSRLGFVEANVDEHLLVQKEIPCTQGKVVDAPVAELRFVLPADAKQLQYSFLVNASRLTISRIVIQPAR